MKKLSIPQVLFRVTLTLVSVCIIISGSWAQQNPTPKTLYEASKIFQKKFSAIDSTILNRLGRSPEALDSLERMGLLPKTQMSSPNSKLPENLHYHLRLDNPNLMIDEQSSLKYSAIQSKDISFYNTLLKREFPFIQSIFPNSYAAAQLLIQMLDKYEINPVMVRSSLLRDFNECDMLLHNLVTEETTHVGKHLKNNLFEKQIHQIANTLARNQQNHFGIHLESVDLSQFESADKKSEILQLLKTWQLFSQYFKSSQSDRYWLNDTELDSLFQDTGRLLGFFRTITELNSNSDIVLQGRPLVEILKEREPMIAAQRLLILAFRKNAVPLDQVTTGFKLLQGRQDSLLHVLNYSQKTNNFVGQIEALSQFLYGSTPPKGVGHFVNMFKLYNGFYTGRSIEDPAMAYSFLAEIMYHLKAAHVSNYYESKQLKKHLSFIVNTLNIKPEDLFSSEGIDYQTKLEASKAKLFIEVTTNIGPALWYQDSFRATLSTPIGLSLEYPLGRKVSLSLMGSVLDIGPFMSNRLTGSPNETPSRIHLLEFFAPGAHLGLRFGSERKFGFSLGYLSTFKISNALTPDLSPLITRKNGLMATFNVKVPIFRIAP